MAATSLKIPDDLKRRIERVAAAARQTPHAFMVAALTRETERSELQAQFAADAAVSERETLSSGKAVRLGTAFAYLEARLAGRRMKRPRPLPWRRSK